MPKEVEIEGKKETVFTQAELDAEREAAITKFKEEHPEDVAGLETLQGELDTVKKQLQEATEALDKAGDKDYNYRRLEDSKKKLEEQLANVDKKIGDAVGAVERRMEGTALDAAVQGLAGQDQELAKKVKFHFEKTLAAVPAKTTDEFRKKIQQAYMLAAGKEPSPNALNSATAGSGGGAAPYGGANGGGAAGEIKNDVSAEVKNLGAKYFGITDEDWKKHDKRDFSTTE